MEKIIGVQKPTGKVRKQAYVIRPKFGVPDYTK